MPNFVSNILAGLISNIIIFFVGLNWFKIKTIFCRYRIRLADLFGKKALESGKITVVLDVYNDIRLLPGEQQRILGADCISSGSGNRFTKIFPDGHLTAFPGAYGKLLGYCSTRAVGYILYTFSPYFRKNIVIRADEEASANWEGTFICLGSSVSNIKTNDIKLNQDNKLVLEDYNGSITLKNGKKFAVDDRNDKGYILKLKNPFFKDYSLFICSGLGEWGTSGAAFYLTKHWLKINQAFGDDNFVIIVSVNPGADESAKQIYTLCDSDLK
jgi:hypothetical protein